MATVAELTTPVVLVDRPRLEANLSRLQSVCDAAGIELRPHIKTHKMVEVARRQLALGAAGLTCAKLGEAEAMLPAGPRSLFVAHSLVDPQQAPRLTALAGQVADLRFAVTSEAHAEAFLRVAARTGLRLQVMLAVDTGLGREGVRDIPSAQRVAALLARSPHAELRGFYTHEGNLYGISPAEQLARVEAVLERLCATRDAVDPRLPAWPGCSVSAPLVVRASRGRIQAVRPGTYVFGDIFLSRLAGTMQVDEVALHVLATVVDRPEPGLALIDAGSKVFSSDRTPDNVFAMAVDGRDLSVVKVNEEHGHVRGRDVDQLRVGDRLRFIPAHVCPCVNLADEVVVTAGDTVEGTWRVDARGRVR